MRRRARVAQSVLVAALVAGVIAVALHHSEPKYQGYSLVYWLQQYNDVQDSKKIGPADEAIRAIGTNALPRLARDLKRSGSGSFRMLSAICLRHPWIKLPFYGEDHYSGPALLGLNALRSDASPILPELRKLLEDSRTTELAAQAIFSIGPAAIPTLEQVCRNTNILIRVQAAMLISLIESNEIGYGFGWHNSPINGRPILSVGWGLMGREEQTIRRLGEGLQHPDRAVRRANLEALRNISGATTNTSSLFLMRYLQGASEDVRDAKETLRHADAVDY